MKDRQTGSTSYVAEEYLCQAGLLAGSLERAIQAIADNSVETLEYEIREQAHRCDALLAMRRSAAQTDDGRSAPAGTGDLSSHQARVHKNLRLLMERYEAVLHHSGQTIRMLRALSRGASANELLAGQPVDSSIGGLSWLA